jgi:molybdopterin converting factor small subunit
MAAHTIRVELPAHLRTLAHIGGHEVEVRVAGEPTVCAALDALEAEFPMLAGTIRDHVTRERRAFLRFFACMQDISFDPTDAPLPAAVVDGREPLIILGAVAGGSWGSMASNSSLHDRAATDLRRNRPEPVAEVGDQIWASAWGRLSRPIT